MNYTWIELTDSLKAAVPNKINVRTFRKVRALHEKERPEEEADKLEAAMELLLESGAIMILDIKGDASSLDPFLENIDWRTADKAERIEFLSYVPQEVLAEVFQSMQDLMGLTPKEETDLGNSPEG